MSDKCPLHPNKPFDFKKDTVEGRMITRLEDVLTELARKDELLRRAVKLFQSLYMDIDFAKEAIEPGLVELGTLLANLKQIQAFLTTPEVAKVMEGK